jgi:hypothetical protein
MKEGTVQYNSKKENTKIHLSIFAYFSPTKSEGSVESL